MLFDKKRFISKHHINLGLVSLGWITLPSKQLSHGCIMVQDAIKEGIPQYSKFFTKKMYHLASISNIYLLQPPRPKQSGAEEPHTIKP